ncbi:Serine/threonine protein phosphatase PrpC [Tropicimonas isoalkanivorans]|uniref:Serine/threonine protein phosphatase PrpC n=2 Tax=Tropicimonas isoalkanivorans TaxID=441112 RepID=A0A1I1KCL4_9RHOB|nr:Serine/threonine protein phosphatase PrpC [Tropicimonas isoalkanivorans]
MKIPDMVPGMPQRFKGFYEAASAVSVGKRACQEDAVLYDCPLGGDTGLVVVSDGMGGHAAGDVASKIVLTEVFSELKLQSGASAPEEGFRALLTRAAEGADDCIRAYIQDRPESIGMGATLVAVVLHGQQLHWISVGDSVLYLYRNGALHRLNEEHSFGRKMDRLVASGLMDSEAAAEHPDRNCLTSVVGGGGIAQIDCPADPFQLADGDLLVVASDGLEYLSPEEIRTILGDWHAVSSAQIAAQLMRGIEMIDDPEQDNISIVVVKVRLTDTAALRGPKLKSKPPIVPTRPATMVAMKSRAPAGLAGQRRLQCDQG